MQTRDIHAELMTFAGTLIKWHTCILYQWWCDFDLSQVTFGQGQDTPYGQSNLCAK